MIGELLQAKVQPGAGKAWELGEQIGRLYTDHGFPIDMALDRLDYTKEQKLSVLDGALWWLVEHKRRSGASDKALGRQRKANQTIIQRFLDRGETGIY